MAGRRRRRWRRELRAAADDDESGEAESITGLMPDDAMLQVLACFSTRRILSQMALVCRRWHRLCTSYLVVELMPPPIDSSATPWAPLTMQDIAMVASKYASTISRVELVGLLHITSADVISLVESLPLLRNLAIVSCGRINITQVVQHLPPELSSLDLHAQHSLGPSTKPCLHAWRLLFKDDFLPDLQRRCPLLASLDLDCSINVSPTGFLALEPCFGKLGRLDLYSQELGWGHVSRILQCCPCLTHLSLVSARLSERPAGRPMPAAPSCTTCLRLYCSPHLSAPMDLLPAAKQLTELHAQGLFSHSWSVSSLAFPHLMVLDLCNSQLGELSPLEEQVLCELPRRLKKLRRLALPTATDRVLAQLGRFCPHLEELRFQRCGGRRSKSCVTNTGVMSLVEGCSQLHILSLEGCDNISISATRSIAFHCGRLRVLHLSRCKSLDDDAICALFPRLAHCLRLLDLVGCQRVSAASLEHIKVHGGTSLRVLSIPQALWKSCESLLQDLRRLNPMLKLKSGWCGYVWDGFYHSVQLSELF